jgi:hypothetical protein
LGDSQVTEENGAREKEEKNAVRSDDVADFSSQREGTQEEKIKKG